LFIAFAVGLAIVIVRFRTTYSKWSPLLLALCGSWLGVMLLPNQDPRYAVGVLPIVSVFAAAPFDRKRVAQWVLAGFLVFQHILVSFGIPQLPERIVLRQGPGGELSYDWSLYQQNYFGLWGPPREEDWHIDRVLKQVAENSGMPARIGLVPDLPRLDVPAYQFAIDLNGYPITISRQFSPEASSLLENDYLLLAFGRQTAFGSVAPKAEEINAFVATRSDRFKLIDSFVLPSGETVRLYRCVR
jgi:hypothetical protein